MGEKPTIYVIDDNQQITELLEGLFESLDYGVKAFCSAKDFLASYLPGQHGCLVSDVRMPGITGLELQEILIEKGFRIPIIFITAHADVGMAVRAMKLGAVDFLTKPLNNQVLLEAINKAVDLDGEFKREAIRLEKTQEKAGRLTPRENEVLALILGGKLNKNIASDLGISQRTVELHRANIMRKMGARTTAELIRIAFVSGLVDKLEKK